MSNKIINTNPEEEGTTIVHMKKTRNHYKKTTIMGQLKYEDNDIEYNIAAGKGTIVVFKDVDENEKNEFRCSDERDIS